MRQVAKLAGILAIFFAGAAHAGPPQTIEQAAEAPQRFYPVGENSLNGDPLRFYVLGGDLSIVGQPVLRGAALINWLKGGELNQIVEIQSIDCASRAATATFRIFYRNGDLTDATGPVDKDNQEVLLSADAESKMMHLLCDKALPPAAAIEQTLADFRKVSN
jgi:hypothetical protein